VEWDNNLSKLPWLERPTTGDASETALIKFFQPIHDVAQTREMFQLVKDKEGKPAKMPFNSSNKYAFLIVEYETEESHYCLFTKGAPERIWGLCTSVYNKNQI
jgi:sodium/potassium-transporting ATPase subunit alpha